MTLIYNPRVWMLTFTLLMILMVVARCDDFSTYPKD